MSSSPVLNVVRYSALVGGIGYGILHRRTLQAKEDVKAAHAEYKHKEHLIQKAKEAYKNRLVAKQSDTGIVTDPENPAFDLEKFLTKLEQESK
ncbi:related to TIM11 - subunit E of the dimeric form of mitochondrial F1F0-ATPase [Ustilago trichophora]|uniref:ATP synthase F(0) complex subunit e, mitochondrial n=1 Tax=Ustilago trichophora TaxID=86804 RepID=A0A5C3E0R1_9BASI|nr:related to TIM11 - subunit E of the dimeric form of mitochondrial F1F0-ATPase [Ustilago trichophora]